MCAPYDWALRRDGIRNLRRPEDWPRVRKSVGAGEHFAYALQTEIERFENEDPAVIVAEFKPDRSSRDLRYVVRRQVPPEFAPTIGDVIRNLGSSLHRAVFELTLVHVGHELENTTCTE